jgi:prephenate dehydrogenase
LYKKSNIKGFKKMQIAIIGLGLMGGSFALTMREKYKDRDLEIVGYDHNHQHSLKALELGLVDRIAEELKEFKDFDLIILAVPVDGIISTIKKLTFVSQKTTIIDFGGTKSKIVNEIPLSIRENVVAAHPMTGTEKFGPTAAIHNLYRGKVIVFCDIEKSGKYQSKFAREIFSKLGMKIFYMNADEHDKHAAYISHMPHALSYSLANSVMNQENPEAIIALAGGGFKDMSRIAKSSPNMWVDIFKQNRENILEAIQSFKRELNFCEEIVESKDWDKLHKWMKEANKLHNIL